ncbi:hypothetical protein BH10CYA1_BH10CYA1_41810 [soil metagenome]
MAGTLAQVAGAKVCKTYHKKLRCAGREVKREVRLGLFCRVDKESECMSELYVFYRIKVNNRRSF